MRSLAPFCVALALFAACGPAAFAAGRDADALLDALPERVESQSVPVRRIPLVLWYLDYDEVLVGSAEGPARLSGEWDLDLGNRAGSLRCIGSARNRVVPPQAVEGERCDGVSGDAVLSCSDGRTIRLRIDREEHCLAATGRGRDSAGNPVRALLGGSRARLEALVTGVLAETAGRPLLASAAASRAATAPRGVRSGTAFFISTDGYLVTADHVVARAQRVEGRLALLQRGFFVSAAVQLNRFGDLAADVRADAVRGLLVVGIERRGREVHRASGRCARRHQRRGAE